MEAVWMDGSIVSCCFEDSRLVGMEESQYSS